MIYLGERGSKEITRIFMGFLRTCEWEKSVLLTSFSCFAGLVFFSAAGVVFRGLPGPSLGELFLLLLPIPPLLAFAAFTQFVFNRMIKPQPARALFSPLLIAVCCLAYVICGRITGADARLERHAIVYHCLEHPSPMCREVVHRQLRDFNEEEILRIEARANPDRRFAEDLAPLTRAALEARYEAVVKAFAERDFELVEKGAREILATVYDFKDVRTYAAIAHRELDKEREYRHREAVRENLEFHLRQIDALVESAGPLVARAGKDPRAAGELRRLAGDILSVNRGDGRAMLWLHELNRGPASR